MIPSLQDVIPSLQGSSLPTLDGYSTAMTRRIPALTQPQRGSGGASLPPGLTQEEQEYWLKKLARQSGQFIETLGLILDTPGAIARGYMAGDPESGFHFDSDRRVSGAELLESMGLRTENPYLRAASGLGTEIVTDPLFWLSGPMNAVSKAGYTAKQAGLLKSAPLAYMQKYGTDAAEQTARGKYITGLFDANYVPKTAGNYQAVTPVGQRLAQSKVSLEDVVNASPDKNEALQSVLTHLGGGPVAQAEYDRIKGDTLGGLFGVNVGSLNAAFNPAGSATILDAMDKLGAQARFSKVGRVASGLFDKRVGGTVDTDEQIAALRASGLEDMFRRHGQEAATKHNLLLSKATMSDQAKQLLGADSLYSTQGNDMLVRLAEGKGTPKDQQILAATPGLQEWLDSWHDISNRQFAERKAMGLKGAFYKDPYGVLYNPRYGDEFDFEDAAKGTGRMLYGANEAEAYGRRSYLKTPGGTDDLRQISLLPEIIQYSQKGSTITDSQAATAIKDWFAANHPAEPIQDVQALKIARTMQRRAQDLPPGTPVFAAHPANAQARRIVSHEIAKSRVAFLLEALSEAAAPGAHTQMQGRFRNLGKSWEEVASKAGFQMGKRSLANNASNALKIALSKAHGTPLEQIDLSKWSIPEPVVRRLEKIADFYSEPAAQKEVAGFLDGWTTIFKGFVLATPRRFVRDLYSNAISGFLETGSAGKQLAGMTAASKILDGDYAGGMSVLRQIPKYAGLGSDEAIKDAFLVDVGTHGVLSGLQSSELLATTREGRMGQFLPGSTPISVAKGLQELIPDGSTTAMQKLRNFGSIYGVTDKYDTQNPILRASTTINDTIDSIGRLGTFIALMRQGVDPAEAAARVKRALVDYQSLTLTERKWAKSVFPWWAYNSRIGKYAVESLMSRPGGAYGQMIRASNTLQQADEDTYIPENLRQKFSVRVPDEWLKALGVYDPNVTTHVVDFDAPGVDVLDLPGKTVGETLNNLATQMAPPIQGFMSLATGRDLFFDRPLDETTTPQDRLYKAFTGSPEGLSPAAKVGIGLIPGIQVPLNIAGTLADERIEDPLLRGLKAGINYTSGLKIANLDRGAPGTAPGMEALSGLQAIEDQQKKIAKELAGKTRTLSRVYVPEELEPTLTPREQALWELSQIQNKRAIALKQQRRQQELARQRIKAQQMPYPF